MTETPQPTIEYARHSAVSGAPFFGDRRAILINGQEVGRLGLEVGNYDQCPDGRACLWVVLWGGRVPDWQKWATFPTRDAATAWVTANAATLLVESR